jgi:hypothetical protein
MRRQVDPEGLAVGAAQEPDELVDDLPADVTAQAQHRVFAAQLQLVMEHPRHDREYAPAS